MIKQQDGSTMIQDISNFEDYAFQNKVSQKKENLEIQQPDDLQNNNDLSPQQISEEEYYDEEVEEIKVQSSLMTPLGALKEPTSPYPPLIQDQERKITESIFMSSSEFKSSFEEMKEAFRVIIHQPPQ